MGSWSMPHAIHPRPSLGLCSFSVASPPEDVARRMEIYHKAVEACTTPIGRTVNNSTAAFTMVNCAPTVDESRKISEESFLWYVKTSVTLISSVAAWMEERNQELGTYDYLKEINKMVEDKLVDLLNWDYLDSSNAVLWGTPDQLIETGKLYEQAGVDLLLCLVNPYNVPHEKVMQTIELMGKHVIPEFN